jgi:hypothetical protein
VYIKYSTKVTKQNSGMLKEIKLETEVKTLRESFLDESTNLPKEIVPGGEQTLEASWLST